MAYHDDEDYEEQDNSNSRPSYNEHNRAMENDHKEYDDDEDDEGESDGFGDDFDNFEEGGAADDFGDFGDGTQTPALEIDRPDSPKPPPRLRECPFVSRILAASKFVKLYHCSNSEILRRKLIYSYNSACSRFFQSQVIGQYYRSHFTAPLRSISCRTTAEAFANIHPNRHKFRIPDRPLPFPMVPARHPTSLTAS